MALPVTEREDSVGIGARDGDQRLDLQASIDL